MSLDNLKFHFNHLLVEKKYIIVINNQKSGHVN